MAITTLHFLILIILFLLCTSHFSLAASRPISDDFKKQPHRRLSPDSFTNLDQQSLFPMPLAGDKSMPTESLLPSFPTFLRPYFPSPFGRFRPNFPYPTIPRILPRFPPYPPTNHDDPNMPSKPSVPSGQTPPVGHVFPGSPPAAALP